ncbi:MAG: hypothetical protein COA64_13840 [Henriciella sp.]|nr:MAG: hypothetical protein COA64_13840 [Henriciella sp.]
MINADLKCFYRPIDDPDDVEKLKSDNAALSFALNSVASHSPILIGETYIFKKVKAQKLITVLPSHNYFSIHESNQLKFKLEKSTTPKKIEALFEASRISIDKDPSILISMSRFGTALLRANIADTYLDLAISLEALLQVRGELSYQFQTVLAHLVQQDTSKRLETAGLLKKFYNARSRVVHGDAKPKDYLSEEEFDRFVAIAKLAVLYKVMWLADHDAKNWRSHLLSIAVGQETPNW